MIPYSYNATLVKVIDGDSLELEVDCGFNIFHTATFQLAGLDAPEVVGKLAKAGKEAKKMLKEYLTTAHRICVRPTGLRTGAGRWWAYVDVTDAEGKGCCVNDQLLTLGLATARD